MSMTKQEAIDQMHNGVKITHIYFDKNEWMAIENDEIVLEDGVKCSFEEYWKYRTQDFWDDGYSVFEPKI